MFAKTEDMYSTPACRYIYYSNIILMTYGLANQKHIRSTVENTVIHIVSVKCNRLNVCLIVNSKCDRIIITCESDTLSKAIKFVF